MLSILAIRASYPACLTTSNCRLPLSVQRSLHILQRTPLGSQLSRLRSRVYTAGPQAELGPLCAKLKDEGVFVRELDTLGIAYHSPALEPFCDKLRKVLAGVLPAPKERSARWLSTCYALDAEEAGCKSCGPDYHVCLLPTAPYTSPFAL